MKIQKHSIIELEGGHKFLMLNAQRIGERNFCLLFAPLDRGEDEPIQMHVGELSISNEGRAQISLYEGEDYKDILLALTKPPSQ